MTTESTEVIAFIRGASFSVEAHQLKTGEWGAFLSSEKILNPCGAYNVAVVRDKHGNIITSPSKEELKDKLKTEYPNWEWKGK